MATGGVSVTSTCDGRVKMCSVSAWRAGLVAGLCAALVLAGTGSAGCRSNSAKRGDAPTDTGLRVDNVVLISIDSLRADHLGVYGYEKPTSPTLDSLATRGVVFSRAYSTTSWTLPAHTAMLTGLDDRAHGVRRHKKKVAPEIPTLAEELRKNEIRTTGFYSGPYLHPNFGFDRGFDEYVNCSSVLPDGVGSSIGMAHFASFKDETNPIILTNVRRWLESGTAGRRNFIFIHMWDVHYSYTPPDRYVEMFDPDYTGTIDGRVFNNPDVHRDMDRRDLRHLIARYDGEIRYTDETIAEILRMLDDAGLLENSAVIVTSDHGQEFLERGETGHHSTLFEEVLHVPLIMHVEGRAPRAPRVDSVVSIIDIYSTVCELFGAPCVVSSDTGESLVKFYTDGAAVRSRDDALANLSILRVVPNTASDFKMLDEVELDAVVTGDGKVVRWQGRKVARELLRAQLPDQPVADDVDTVRGVDIFFDPQALRGERRGVMVHADDVESVAGRTRSRLHARMNAADARHAELVTGRPDDAPEITDDIAERLRALGYME